MTALDSSRQRQGPACARCRGKKLKCDGLRPRCSTCVGVDVHCEPAAPQVQRGPKKGYLKTLQNKIATLEQHLATATHTNDTNITTNTTTTSPGSIPPVDLDLCALDQSSLDLFPAHSSPSFSVSNNPPLDFSVNPSCHAFDSNVSLASPAELLQTPFPAPTSHSPIDDSLFGFAESTADLPQALGDGSSSPIHLSELAQSDLSQVYFDRTHPSVPILHRHRYFSWAQSPSKTPAQICLQHAMWASAASLSPHPQPLGKSLHQAARRMLAASSEDPQTTTSIEYVQAHILTAMYEFVQCSHRQGWVTAGQCFRNVQLLRLHELDDSNQQQRPVPDQSVESLVQYEERRRAFWMAYCLDVLVSKRGQWPLTLHEHVHGTRLPLPDHAFQNNDLSPTPHLHEVLDGELVMWTNSLVDLIVLCTISRNIALLKRQHGRSAALPLAEQLERHSQLTGKLDARLAALRAKYSPLMLLGEPILLFAQTFAHALMLCLCGWLRKATSVEPDTHRELLTMWDARTAKAVPNIISLARSIPSLSYFKMHPFTPLPLAICRDFLGTMCWADTAAAPRLVELSRLLQDMSPFNNVALDYLEECEACPVP